MADIVLPATMFLEHDDYYTASGHTFLQVARKVIEPPEGCRENHWVNCEIAKRVGAEHPGFEMTAWELIAETFRRSGHPSPEEVHDERGHDCAMPFEEMHHLKGFPQPDGRFHFRADWAGVGRDHQGMPPLADHWTAIEQADAEHPFRLVAAPARAFLNTSFTETPGSQKREGRPEILLHPEDCAELGAGAGDRLRIGNDRGSLVIHVRPFDGLQRGVAVVESIHPNAAFEEGVGINLLTSADAGAPRGGAVFHDTAIWIRKA
jgi:anaerobic selenocysteine-containing dehydrogenase